MMGTGKIIDKIKEIFDPLGLVSLVKAGDHISFIIYNNDFSSHQLVNLYHYNDLDECDIILDLEVRRDKVAAELTMHNLANPKEELDYNFVEELKKQYQKITKESYNTRGVDQQQDDDIYFKEKQLKEEEAKDTEEGYRECARLLGEINELKKEVV